MYIQRDEFIFPKMAQAPFPIINFDGYKQQQDKMTERERRRERNTAEHCQ